MMEFMRDAKMQDAKTIAEDAVRLIENHGYPLDAKPHYESYNFFLKLIEADQFLCKYEKELIAIVVWMFVDKNGLEDILLSHGSKWHLPKSYIVGSICYADTIVIHEEYRTINFMRDFCKHVHDKIRLQRGKLFPVIGKFPLFMIRTDNTYRLKQEAMA